MNRACQWMLVSLLVFSLLCCAGCGGKKKTSGKSHKTKASSAVQMENLSEIGAEALRDKLDFSLESLDDGRLFLNVPSSWKLQKRTAKYVVMLRIPDQEGACFYVTAAKAPAKITTLTKDNVEILQTSMVEGKKGSSPVTLGKTLFVYSARISRSDSDDYQNQVLTTIQNGQQYEFILRTYRGEMKPEFIEMLRAIGANARFLSGTDVSN